MIPLKNGREKVDGLLKIVLAEMKFDMYIKFYSSAKILFMKKFFLFFASTVFLYASSCNSPDSTGPERSDTTAQNENDKDTSHPSVANTTLPGEAILTDLCDEAGARDFAIVEAEARPMIDSFEKIFRMSNAKITPNVWVDACIIISLADFIKAHASDYDGVRIYNCADESQGDQTSVLLIPTYKSGNHRPNFSAEYGSDCMNTEYKNHRLTRNERRKQERRFNKIYRKAAREERYRPAENDSFSMGMWVHECVIQSLAQFLKTNSLGLDGVRIHSTYHFEPSTSQEMKPRGRFTAKQASFVLVTTRSNGTSGHEDYWELMNNLFKKKPHFFDGYNHGELCPQVCE